MFAVVRRVPVPAWILTFAIVWWTVYWGTRTLDLHHGLGTAGYDSGLYDQGMWLLSQFDAPFVTIMGRNLFGDHTSFVLLLLVPLYWIAPGAWIMFWAQSAVIALGALPVYLYGRRRLESDWLALVGALAYFLHPAVGWTNLENFHPDAFLGFFVGMAIYAALVRKWRLYAVFVVLSLLVKEDVSLVLIPLGVWVAVKRDRRIGLLTVIGSLAFAVVALFVVMRGLNGMATRNSWRIPFGGVGGFLETMVSRPGDVVEHFRSDGRPWYLVQMTAPFAWLFVRLPDVALISSVVLFTNVLSTFWYQYQVEYHYGLVAVPALAIGTVYAIGALPLVVRRRPSSGDGAPARERTRSLSAATSGLDADREVDADGDAARRRPSLWQISAVTASPRRTAVVVLLAASLITGWLWSPLPGARWPGYFGNPSSAVAVDADELIDLIPPDAVVAAHYRLVPHLAYRTEIYQFPTPFRSVLYGSDGNVDGPRIVDRAERVEYVALPRNIEDTLAIDWVAIEAAFELVEAKRFWLLYRRIPDRPLPGALGPPLGGD